ncbi:glycosyltransferase [uncultured Clostridium sp.]|uniref:glycosyltransferase n=1 Tax=uncultured Clostridium sp. TaxID=59620 RepID=UPI0025DC757D|nr:glycosyltransferase [uncultured Clostridium sp.]MDU2291427.1 glycosyltransferase [Clostridium celatum]
MEKEKLITVWHMNGVMDAGGTESLIMNIFRYHTGRVRHVLVIHGAKDGQKGIYDDEIKDIGIPMYYLPAVGEGVRKYSVALRKLIDKVGKPDVIHSHLNGIGGVIAKVAKEEGIKHRIVHCHADITFRGSKISNAMNEIKLATMKILVNKYGNHFFSCSTNAAKRLFYKPDKAIIINNAISVEDYLCDMEKRNIQKKEIGISENNLVVGSVGRISRIKNYELVLKAISKLIHTGKNIIFVCYGRIVDWEYYEELVDICKSEQIEENVRFMGNSEQIYNDLAAFDIFVMPSITEGLGIAALEAQAAGKKVILSTGVPKEADMDLGLVTYIEANDISGLADTIEKFNVKIVTHDEIRKKFKERGFDARYEVEKIEKIYLKIVGDKYER